MSEGPRGRGFGVDLWRGGSVEWGWGCRYGRDEGSEMDVN